MLPSTVHDDKHAKAQGQAVRRARAQWAAAGLVVLALGAWLLLRAGSGPEAPELPPAVASANATAPPPSAEERAGNALVEVRAAARAGGQLRVLGPRTWTGELTAPRPGWMQIDQGGLRAQCVSMCEDSRTVCSKLCISDLDAMPRCVRVCGINAAVHASVCLLCGRASAAPP